MDWTNKNVDPKKVVQLGDEVEVMVLEIDEERRRHLARHEAMQAQPLGRLRHFAQEGRSGARQIKSITDFGVFIGLPGASTGWYTCPTFHGGEPGEEAVRRYKKGDEVEAMVLAIDTSASASRWA